jgi:3-oxoacyl-[acyl-carrier protein] reductase
MPLSSGLTGQRVLVTGASQGIGFGAAKSFLEEGARVVINSSNQEKIDRARSQLSSLGEIHSVAADISNKSDIERLVSETARLLGGIDTLVYVTGSPAPGSFMEKDYEEWEAAARLLAVSPSYLARKVAEIMIGQNVKGRLVFSASWVIKEPMPNLALSNVMRISIAGIVRTLARDLAPKGIRVNAVLPGFIMTGRINQIAEANAARKKISVDEALKEIEGQVPLGRIGTTEELAKAIIFLGSEMSSYITGAVLPVDGGIMRSIF